MFIITWLMVLFLSLCILYLTFMVWLAHSLEGYPAFLLSHASRDTTQSPGVSIVPNRLALLDTFASRRPIRARRELLTTSTTDPRANKSAERSKTVVS
jgi:Ca2+/Na+ antiporter